MMLIVRGAGRGAFKGIALIGAFVIIIAVWWWDASLLTLPEYQCRVHPID